VTYTALRQFCFLWWQNRRALEFSGLGLYATRRHVHLRRSTLSHVVFRWLFALYASSWRRMIKSSRMKWNETSDSPKGGTKTFSRSSDCYLVNIIAVSVSYVSMPRGTNRSRRWQQGNVCLSRYCRKPSVCGFRLTPRCWRYLHSSGVLRSVGW
jgi:hypothetical protein